MFKKFVVFTLLIVFQANFFTLSAQENKGKVAQVKFNLTDFRNPSILRGRFGLLQFSRDGRLLATTGTDRDLKIYDVETGKLKATIDSKKAGLSGKMGFNAFSFSPDGKIAVAQEEGYANLKVFDTETGNLVRTIDGRGKISSAKLIMSATRENDLEGLEMIPVPSDSDWKNILVAKNDGLFQVVGIENGEVKQTLLHTSNSSNTWDFMKLVFQAYVPIPLAYLISNGRFSADGKKIIIANGDKSPTLWDAETGKRIAALEPQTDRVYRAFFSPDNSMVVTSDVDGATKVWNAADGKLISSFGSEKDKNFAVAWNFSSDAIVTITPKADARFWDARTGKILFSLEKSEASNAAFSPDGKLLATIHQDDKKQMAQIWNAADGKLIATLPRAKSEDRAFSLVWSPDGRMLVTASSDLVKLWSADGTLLQTLENAVFPTRFSADGTLLATGGKNDIGFVWQINRNW
jgi:WD40 repeat protein